MRICCKISCVRCATCNMCLLQIYLVFGIICESGKSKCIFNKLTKLGRCDSYTIDWLNNRTARLFVLLGIQAQTARIHLAPLGSTWVHLGALGSTWCRIGPLKSTLAWSTLSHCCAIFLGNLGIEI